MLAYLRRFRWSDRAYWLLQGVDFLVSVGWYCAAPYLAVFLHVSLGVPLSWVGSFFALSVVIPAIFSFGFGACLDQGRLARYFPLATSLLLAIAVIIIFKYHQNFVLLCIGGVLLGIARSALSVFSSYYIAQYYPDEVKFEAFGFNYMIFNFGAAVGAFVGARLSILFSAGFFVGMLIFTLLGAISLAFFRLPSLAVTTLNNTLNESLMRHKRYRKLMYFLIASFLFNLVFSQVMVAFPLIIQMRYLDDWQTIFSTMFMINAGGVVLFQEPISILCNKLGVVRSILLGSLLFVAAFVLMNFAKTNFMYYAVAALYTLGEIAISPTMQVLVDRLALPNQKGRFFGISNIGMLGRGFAPVVGTFLLANGSLSFFFKSFILLIILMTLFFIQSQPKYVNNK